MGKSAKTVRRLSGETPDLPTERRCRVERVVEWVLFVVLLAFLLWNMGYGFWCLAHGLGFQTGGR